MIKVILFLKNEQIVGFEVSGHAGYGKYNHDIVCAAVSMLTITIANSIEHLTEDKFAIDYHDDGYTKLILEESISTETNTLLEAFRLGVKSIQESYKKNISIHFKEVS